MRVASAWAVHSVAEVRSACRPSLSSSLRCWAVLPVGFLAVPTHRENQIPQRLVERVMPWALTMCVTTPMQQLQCLPHTGQSAGRRIVAGWVQREEEAFPCKVLCVSAVRHPRRTNGMCVGWRVAVVVAAIRIVWETPVRRRSSAASSPRVRVASVQLGSQSPDTVERQASGLSCRARIIPSANATMPVLHVPLSCARSDASSAYASHASF
ncbi:hypothetical protein TcCL_NonESM11973, partial [Trypanosoma cruzi]